MKAYRLMASVYSFSDSRSLAMLKVTVRHSGEYSTVSNTSGDRRRSGDSSCATDAPQNGHVTTGRPPTQRSRGIATHHCDDARNLLHSLGELLVRLRETLQPAPTRRKTQEDATILFVRRRPRQGTCEGRGKRESYRDTDAVCKGDSM
jgi:hypothetical protein